MRKLCSGRLQPTKINKNLTMKYFVIQILVIFTLTLLLVNAQAQQIDFQQKPMVVEAFAYAVTPPLRDLKNIPPKPGQPREIPLRKRPLQALPGVSMDPVIQDRPENEPVPLAIQSFEGLSCADNEAVHGFRVVPPDTNGDIGPNHYVQYLNLVFAIYDKSGNILVGPFPNYALWEDLGLPPGVEPWGDPIVLYDHLADRWMMSEFAFPSSYKPSYQLIAVSTTPDPTGAWYTYAFKISDTKMNDYPKLGVWPDGYYASFNMFQPPLFLYKGVGVAVFERDEMLAGNPAARMVYFEMGASYFSMLPADLDGPEPPPGTPNYFVEMEPDEYGWPQDQLGIFAFQVDWSNTSNSTFTRIGSLPTAAFDSSVDNIPQKDISDGLDSLSDRLMHRLQYRNFDTHQSMVTNHTVDVNGANRAGIRWYELRDDGGGWSIYQQGTYAPQYGGRFGEIHRWMGSIAMNGVGNTALGYSVSGNSIYPSIVVTGRRASDPLGIMKKEVLGFAGTGSQTDSYNRWGDYSMMAVDPTDDATFWYTQEYYEVTSDYNWKTRICSLAFPVKPVAAAESFDARLQSALNKAPVHFALHQSYPNPFNPEVWLPYNLAADADVMIKIYDAKGQIVRTLNLGHKEAGSYVDKSKASYWDGRNEAGEKVASGVYFYTIHAGKFTATKKMLVIR